MLNYARILGDTVKSACGRLGLTRGEVAERIDVDSRTILNIENYKSNPKLEVLFPLVRTLKIDAREIFNPELQRDTPSIQQLRLIVEDCSEEEASTLIPVFNSMLSAIREKNGTYAIK